MDLHDIIDEIPHGHGLSFKKGISDGILDKDTFKDYLPNGHNSSYESGIKLGKKLQKIVGEKVRR